MPSKVIKLTLKVSNKTIADKSVYAIDSPYRENFLFKERLFVVDGKTSPDSRWGSPSGVTVFVNTTNNKTTS